MKMLDRYDKLFIWTSFAIQIILLAYFALRTWQFELAMRVGWVIYALALPTAAVSFLLIKNRKPWTLWLAGVLYAGWSLFGFLVDIAYPVPWRAPILWPVFLVYVVLYMAALMFYWWPLGQLKRPLWFAYAILFVVSTIFNFTSHGA